MAENPDTCYSPGWILSAPYMRIVQTPEPSYNSATHRARPGVVLTGGEWVLTWEVVLMTPQEATERAGKVLAALQAARAAALVKIDADTDGIYRATLGDRAAEYSEAESAAAAFKAANYTGIVPPMVQSWADAKGWTPKQSADDILVTAAQWRAAQAAIRAERLNRKEQARLAPSLQAIAQVLAQWDGFVTAIRTQLGV